jgi:formate--tetrahydrofolate ligase
MKTVFELAENLNIDKDYLVPYGYDKAKIDLQYMDKLKDTRDGKLVLVTAITPTKAGEGKTTTTIGLNDGFNKIGVKSIACLREPSLGPVWGIKGGAVGALKSTIVPSDDINLHFTGDFHALTSTINLIAAVIDNHIYHGNELNIDPNKITWTRALDMNDRALRSVTVAQDDKKCEPHHSEFVITVASELMSVFCLAENEADFIRRANEIIVAYTYEGRPVFLKDFHIGSAIGKMMKQALSPNLVQTLEENPVIVHGGPFANISFGCNSVIATKLSRKLADVVVTEAGFGADLGAEKFLDIKCQYAGIEPSAVVLVATVRALKLHGGIAFENLDQQNIPAVLNGLPNLAQHAENVCKYGIPVVISLNRFPSDTDEEIAEVQKWCENNGYAFALNEAALKGSDGAIALATKVKEVLDTKPSNFKPIYNFSETIIDKISKVCTEIYRADRVEFSEQALQQISLYERMGYSKLPVCISKTPNSFTDDAKVLGAPRNFTINIREVRLYAGAGLIVPLSGSLLMMPGLPKVPRAVDGNN